MAFRGDNEGEETQVGSVGLFTPDTKGDEIISGLLKPVEKFRWINSERGSQDLTKDQKLKAVVIPVCMKRRTQKQGQAGET